MSDFTTQIEALRASRALQPVSVEEEGTSLEQVSEGVYGFTYSPPGESAPIYRQRNYQNFEMHKLAGGVMHVTGFVTQEEASRLEEGSLVEVKLYPEPYKDSSALVSIPLARIGRAMAPSRSDGNYSLLHLL